MKIDNEPKLDFDDVLLVPQRSRTASRKEVKTHRHFRFCHSDKEWIGNPIIAANMDTTGTLSMARALQQLGCITCLHKHQSYESIYNYMNMEGLNLDKAWFSIGIKEDRLKELEKFLYHHQRVKPNICIDVANGYTDDFVEFCAKVRKRMKTLRNGHYSPIIMAGNVCTPEMTTELLLHGGVDIVKIGIGPGSACTTRLKTGIGYPQLSSIIECSHAAHGIRNGDGRLGLVCADGGCRKPADVVKAYAAGADFVMLGGMLAGTEECEGEWTYHLDKSLYNDYETVNLYNEQVETEEFRQAICKGGGIIKVPDYDTPYAVLPKYTKQKKSLKFYGMSSKIAQEKHNGGMSDYKSSEGRVKEVDYKGPAKLVIQDILGGIRSACAYSGVIQLKDLSKAAKFVRVNRTHFDQSI